MNDKKQTEEGDRLKAVRCSALLGVVSLFGRRPANGVLKMSTPPLGENKRLSQLVKIENGIVLAGYRSSSFKGVLNIFGHNDVEIHKVFCDDVFEVGHQGFGGHKI